MLDTNLMGKFELIEVKSKRRDSSYCKIDNKKKIFSIPTKFARELSWQNNERVNLYRFGETFMLATDKVGLVTVHRIHSGMMITSVNFCLEVLSRARSCRVFEAWVENDALFFKPKKGDE